MELVSKAVLFATHAHDGMRRKNNPTPYIIHPLEAATIVASVTTDQEIISASLLHDVVEDAGVSIEEVEKEFGPRVAELVLSETENKREGISPEESWQIRKEEALNALAKTKDVAVKMLYLGDKLSNLRSIYIDRQIEGEDVWNKFNQKDPKKHLWYYRTICNLISELSETLAWQEFDNLIRVVFNEKGETHE